MNTKPLAKSSPDYADFLEEDEGEEPPVIPEEDPVDATGKAVYEQPFTDLLIYAEVLLPQGDNIESAKVIGRSKDSSGKVLGEYVVKYRVNMILTHY